MWPAAIGKRTQHRLAARCAVVQSGAAVAADADDDDIEVPSGSRRLVMQPERGAS